MSIFIILTEIWETYDGFSKDVDIYAPSKDTLVMDDQMDFQYNVLEPTIRLHRIMCEVSKYSRTFCIASLV